MSLAGQIAIRGSTVTIRRGTPTSTAGGATNLAWVDATVGERMLFDTPDASLLQRLFGQELRIESRAFAMAAIDVRDNDGLVVTAGDQAGRKFTVAKILAATHGRRDAHFELGLVSAPAGAFV